MFRRRARSIRQRTDSPWRTTALDRKQEQLLREDLEVRDKVKELERLIADAPRMAEETTRKQREELLVRASEEGSRLNVSIALQDKRHGGESGRTHRRGSLRKERREGRIVFIVLVIALLALVIWLASHLRF